MTISLGLLNSCKTEMEYPPLAYSERHLRQVSAQAIVQHRVHWRSTYPHEVSSVWDFISAIPPANRGSHVTNGAGALGLFCGAFP